MVVANVIHNQPFAPSNFNVLGAGLTCLGSMMLLAYALYVYANITKQPHDMYLQVGLKTPSTSASPPPWPFSPSSMAYSAQPRLDGGSSQ
jgi:hypothetical protein